ncbi:AraC family transcriptional activator of pobA [Paracoccus pantotrophus]|uniref:AraC family transcriptional activator of pobA n=1 Tax=Paracoccus pantotrophus TaxID=82367 RepID=A0AAE6TSA1_PARPN|nr:AraC family transcriptional regulator [Paracoccus pantotrophus]QFG35278.1 helix-turn-helix transcriptional regulator [Paracoccus pantotrophus]RKS44527.1 AraC family transcriptional activator of pobA [Paracoccus pantotrophus]
MDEARRHLIPPDPVLARLAAAGITLETIPEPADPDPRPNVALTPAAFGRPLAPAPCLAPSPFRDLLPGPAGPGQAAALQPRCALPGGRPGGGLRLIPLAGLHWGGPVRSPAAPRSPRVRGDHVLLRPTGGTVAIMFPGHHHVLPAGRIAFIPAGTAFSLNPPPEVHGLALLIPPAMCRGLTLPQGLRHGLPGAADAELLDAAMTALGAGMPRAPAQNAATARGLGLIAAVLSRLGDGQGAGLAPSAPSPAGLAEARALTGHFLQLAQAELQSGQTIAELALRLGCSQAQLDRACRLSRGRSALELLYDLRLQCASKALRDGDLPMAQIAARLGYSGLGHFMRAFLAATGRTPQAYRALMRETHSRPGDRPAG